MKTKMISAGLAIASAFLSTSGVLLLPGSRASAQLSVFDPTNHAQNVLAAARTLQQINQQIQSLQNEAQMLTAMGRNLARIDFPQLGALQQRLREIDRLMGQAQGVDFRIDQLDTRFRSLFPGEAEGLLGRDGRVARARAQLDGAMAAFRQTMGVQNRIVENVRADAEAIAGIVAQSQSAEGGLAAAQAANQLLALTAQQQLQIQTLLAAQFRAESVEQARRGQVEREARASTRRFLGDGRAWSRRD